MGVKGQKEEVKGNLDFEVGLSARCWGDTGLQQACASEVSGFKGLVGPRQGRRRVKWPESDSCGRSEWSLKRRACMAWGIRTLLGGTQICNSVLEGAATGGDFGQRVRCGRG